MEPLSKDFPSGSPAPFRHASANPRLTGMPLPDLQFPLEFSMRPARTFGRMHPSRLVEAAGVEPAPHRNTNWLMARDFSSELAGNSLPCGQLVVLWSALESSGVLPGLVAVGTPVARRPPHRSGRAGLPHPAPTLGDDAEA